MHEPWYAEQGIGPEDEWVDEVVVHPPVDHVHAPQPLCGAHIDEAVVDEEISPFHELRAYFACQENVLVESGVVDSGGQQHDRRVGLPLRRELAQGLLEHASVARHLPYAGASVEAAQARLGHLPVSQHVGHAGGDAQVVLQHHEAVVGTHEVGSADGYPCPVGRGESAHLDPVLGTTSHHIGRNDAVTDDAGPAVDVFQEEVQRLYALGQPRLEMQPIGTRNYPRQTVNGNRPLLGLFVPVHRKCNAFVRKRARNPVLDVDQLLLGELGQSLVDLPVMFPGGAVRQEHLVVC